MTTRLVAIPRRTWAGDTRALASVVVASLAVASLAGIVAGRSLAPRENVRLEPLVMVQAGTARLIVPADWQPATLRSAGVAGLDPRNTVVLEPYPGSSARVIATFARADHASLIPAVLRDLLRKRLPPPVATRLARWPVWQYLALLTRSGGRTADVTVIPTTRGVLAVACLRPVAVVDAGCTPGVEAISVIDASPLLPSTSLASALQLPAVLRPLDRARVNGRTALEHAVSPAAQAAIARRLARAYSFAAVSLRARAGEAAAPLGQRLVGTSRAYGHLSAAAAEGSVARFHAASEEVDRAEAGVKRAVARIRAAL